MNGEFYKYHGTGNDFILIDNRNNQIKPTQKWVESLCHRRFGIGADGLMLLNSHDKYDFEMIYYNSDGQLGSMCGNGGRCIAAFAHQLKIVTDTAIFLASDGVHKATINGQENNITSIKLQMKDVDKIKLIGEGFFLDTGSPHYIVFKNNLKEVDVFGEGNIVRHSSMFEPDGVNVNFVELMEEYIFVRTFERGVEDETFSCGTGVTAAALASSRILKTGRRRYKVRTLGGMLEVSYSKIGTKFIDVWLEGPAEFVFKGNINF